MIRFLLCCAFVLVSVHAACDRSLADLSYRLSGSDLQWPCQSTKNIYVSSGRYVPKNVIITRAQMWNDQVIVAMPRYKPGVPFTLGKMSLAKASKCIASLAPFPCWSMQEEGNCEALQSVVDIFLDPMVIIKRNDTQWNYIFFARDYNIVVFRIYCGFSMLVLLTH